MTLNERMEAARIAGNRDEFLRLKAQIEADRRAGIQKRHAEEVARAKKDFPVGEYIDGVGRIEAITDGCGTERGWVAVKIAGTERTISPAEIRAALYRRKEAARINAAYSAIKCPGTAHGGVYIPGDYEEAIDDLLKYMDLDRIWTAMPIMSIKSRY